MKYSLLLFLVFRHRRMTWIHRMTSSFVSTYIYFSNKRICSAAADEVWSSPKSNFRPHPGTKSGFPHRVGVCLDDISKIQTVSLMQKRQIWAGRVNSRFSSSAWFPWSVTVPCLTLLYFKPVDRDNVLGEREAREPAFYCRQTENTCFLFLLVTGGFQNICEDFS